MSRVLFKTIISTLLAMVLLAAVVQPVPFVLAHDPMPPDRERPTPGIAPPGPENPLVGEITPGVDPLGEVQPLHFDLTPHIHYVDGIYNRYDGYLDRGEVASAYNPGPTESRIKFSITRYTSNSWSVSICFAKEPVEAAVGYSVEYGISQTFEYEVSIPAGYTVHVYYQDWYHVQEYNCHTDWNFGGTIVREDGQGWASQWFKYHFYHAFTPGNTP